MKKKFATIRVPEELAEELRLWKTAFERSYKRGNLSFEFMLRSMLDSLVDSEPAVYEEMTKMIQEDPSLIDKMGNFKGGR